MADEGADTDAVAAAVGALAQGLLDGAYPAERPWARLAAKVAMRWRSSPVGGWPRAAS